MIIIDSNNNILVQTLSEAQRLLYGIPLLNMQHQSGRELITLTHWIHKYTACRTITGCQKPTNVEDMYLFARISTPDIIRDVCARVEKESNVAHSLYGQNPKESRLKSRGCSLSSVRTERLFAVMNGNIG